MEILLTIKYDLLGKIFALLFRTFGFLIGLFLLFPNNYIVTLIGIIFVVLAFVDFFNILFFDSLTFYNDKIVKKTNIFGKRNQRSLDYLKMDTSVSKRFFGGSLMFWEKENRFKTYWFFIFDLLPISNNEFKKIRKILINKNIIDGDFEWNS